MTTIVICRGGGVEVVGFSIEMIEVDIIASSNSYQIALWMPCQVSNFLIEFDIFGSGQWGGLPLASISRVDSLHVLHLGRSRIEYHKVVGIRTRQQMAIDNNNNK